MVNTIWFRFDLIRFRNDICVCTADFFCRNFRDLVILNNWGQEQQKWTWAFCCTKWTWDTIRNYEVMVFFFIWSWRSWIFIDLKKQALLTCFFFSFSILRILLKVLYIWEASEHIALIRHSNPAQPQLWLHWVGLGSAKQIHYFKRIICRWNACTNWIEFFS